MAAEDAHDGVSRRPLRPPFTLGPAGTPAARADKVGPSASPLLAPSATGLGCQFHERWRVRPQLVGGTWHPGGLRGKEVRGMASRQSTVTFEVTPSAARLTESLRDVGYD